MKIAEIIGALHAQGDAANSFDEAYDTPRPLDAAAIAQLRLPGGEPVPEDLAAWLAYDATWLGLLHAGQLRSTPLRDWLSELAGELAETYEDEDEELREWVSDELESDEPIADEQLVEWWIEQLPSPALADVHVVRLPSGDQDNLLMLEPGRDALRVLGFHKFIEFWWKYDAFADYLTHWLGFEER